MWTYVQHTGEFLHNGLQVATGYSGCGLGKNNPDLQYVSGVGPLPCGTFDIGPSTNSAHTGQHIMHLTPNPATQEMFGRGDFEIHGDSKEHPGMASHGCIILPLLVREQITASGDTKLEVIQDKVE